MFLHGDLLHPFGKMIFLLVFGRRMENQLERINFLAFYLTAGIAAALAHMVPDSSEPLIGTSASTHPRRGPDNSHLDLKIEQI
jgi:excisionase family DNA binding protein